MTPRRRAGTTAGFAARLCVGRVSASIVSIELIALRLRADRVPELGGNGNGAGPAVSGGRRVGGRVGASRREEQPSPAEQPAWEGAFSARAMRHVRRASRDARAAA